MSVEARELLKDILNEDLLQMVFSSCRDPQEPSVVKVRPVQLRGELMFQASWREQNKEKHRNMTAAEAEEQSMAWLEGPYHQMQAECTGRTAGILVSKKGKMTVRSRARKDALPARELSHNRKKQYILEEGRPVTFLTELGVMTPEGRVVHKYSDKFRQINRFLEFIEDVVPALPKGREVRIIDFGCGKSYLTFAVYYYLHELRRMDVQIIGLDLKEDVIERCSALAEKCGYDRLRFMPGDIADYEADAREGRPAADMVITLHACDTATDYALAKAVGWNAGVILSVPCCQHELNAQIKNELLSPVLRYGLLKERMSALITDGLRASLLETQGYEVQVLEFIDMEHTPKNILIRAVRRGKRIDPAGIARGKAAKAGEISADSISADTDRQEKIQELEKAIGADLTLERLLSQMSAR